MGDVAEPIKPPTMLLAPVLVTGLTLDAEDPTRVLVNFRVKRKAPVRTIAAGHRPGRIPG